jgi:hypothetical protein
LGTPEPRLRPTPGSSTPRHQCRAALMDVTTHASEGFLSGSVGCIERVSDKHTDPCYGIQPDYYLRLAVIDVGDTTLLAWARSQGVPDKEFHAMFERMLQSVRFR